MKARNLAVAFVVVVASVLLLNAQQAKADHQPIVAADSVLTAINAGDVDAAVDVFAEDAVIENWVRDETYVGTTEIRQMLQGMQHDGRQFDIVDIDMAGDTIMLSVAVSDRGIVWGTETILVEGSDDKLQSFTVTGFDLKF
jgi:hypothetical protein